MKKRILSLVLVAVMILSTFAIIPVTAETTNTFNASDASPLISTAADLVAFANAVNGGNSLSGKTVKLGADIDMTGIDWKGVGATSSKPFSGSFNGQGYTISNMTQSLSNPDGAGGLINFIRVPANSTSVVENLTLTGKIEVSLNNNSGYCVGTVVSCVDAGTSGNGGTFTMRNVHSSVTMNVKQSGSCSATGFGGLLGFTRHADNVKPLTVNIDSCVYSGNMNMGTNVYHSGAIMGTVGNNVTNRPLTVNITNTVFKGVVSLTGYFDHFGIFVSITRQRAGASGEDKGGSVTVNLSDCISLGQVFYNEGLDYGSSAIAIATPHLRSNNNLKLNVKNVYYRTFEAPKNGEMVPVEMVYSGATSSNYTCDANSGVKTTDQILALNASNFSADAKLSFKASTVDEQYYPCPTSLVPAGGWLPVLTSTIGGFSVDNPVIKSAADLVALADAVNNGTTFAGKTVKLLADIDMTGIDFKGIGTVSGKPFSGSFDGQGHTISNMTQSFDDADGHGGLFHMVRTPANGTCTFENFTLTGNITINGGGYTGSVIAACDGNTSGNGGTVILRNVHSSVYINAKYNSTSKKSPTAIGGLVGFTRHASDVKPLNLVVDSCVWDGKINCPSQITNVGGILAYTGNNATSRTLVIDIKNTVVAGTIMLNDIYSDDVGLFIGYLKGNGSGYYGKVTANITDCVSIGAITFYTGDNRVWTPTSKYYGVFTGEATGNYAYLNVKNTYYRPFSIGGEIKYEIKDVQGVTVADHYTIANSGAMALSDIAKLDASAFTSDCKLSFKPTEFDTYYPCPTSMLGENGEWLPVLFAENTDSAKVLGAQIRCTGESDLYSGIRFVAQFKADAVSGANTADANFGIILIAKEFYDVAADKATIEGLLAAGGVEVKASQADASIDGYYRVNAVVYEITADHYTDDIVAIAYVNGELVGDATTRSIYTVATKCVADAAATTAQKTFCQEIIDTVGAN